MKQASVKDILALVNEFAPFQTAEPDDNVGLLIGHPDAQVDTVLVALDLTMGAALEAERVGAQLILTHHPVMFRGRKHMRTDDAEGALIAQMLKSGVAMIAAHTNFDAARGGVSEILAEEAFVKNLSPLRDGLVTIGDYRGTLRELEWRVRERINPHARVYGADRPLSRVAACGGAGSEFWTYAQQAGADCYLLGEIRHHDALAAVQMGMAVIDAGHYETEHLSVKALANGLQTRADAVQYKLRVIESEFHPFL